METNARFQIVEDRPVLHRASEQGVRISRVQRVLDTETGAITEVKFWHSYGPQSCVLHHID